MRKSHFHIIICIGLISSTFINAELFAQTVTTNPSSIGQGAYRVLYLKLVTNISTSNNVSFPFEAKFEAIPSWSESFTMSKGLNTKIYYVVFESVDQWNYFTSKRHFSIHNVFCIKNNLCLLEQLETEDATGLLKTIAKSHYQKPLPCNESYQDNFTAYFTLEWGFCPPKPQLFRIKAYNNYENNWQSTSKITKGDTIKFELTPNENFLNYNIEISKDGGQNWTTFLENILTNKTETINLYGELANHTNGQSGVKMVKFRAKTVYGTSSIVKTSYGYIEQTLEVYPKPEFSIPNQFNVCYGTKVDSLIVSNITVNQYSNKIYIRLKKQGVTEPLNGVSLPDGYSLPPPPIPNTYVFNSLNLEPGTYYVEVENVLRNSDGKLYPCGHTTKTFTVTEKTNLSTYFKNSIESIPCQGNSNTISVLNGNKFPAGVKAYYSTNSFTDSTEFFYNGKIEVTYPSNQIISHLFYTTGDACLAERTHDIFFNYPLLNPVPLIQYPTCSYNPAIVTVNDNNINSFYYKVYKKGSSTGEYKGNDDEWPINSNGTYTIEAAHSNTGLCPVKIDTSITDIPEPISFSANVVSHVTVCNANSDGKITVNLNYAYATSTQKCTLQLKNNLNSVVGQFTYTSTPQTRTFSNLPHGNYVIIVTDGKGCSLTKEVTINNVSSPFDISETIIVDPTCYDPNNDGTFTIKTTGQKKEISMVRRSNNTTWYSFDSSITLDKLSSGNYSYIVMPDGFEKCSLNVSVSLTRPNPYTIDADILQPSCNNAQGEVLLKSGDINHHIKTFYMHSAQGWNAVATNPMLLYSGSHKFRGLDIKNCYSLNKDIVINYKPELAINIIEKSNPKCPGGFGYVKFSVNGGSGNNHIILLDGNVLTNTNSDTEFYFSKNQNGEYTVYNLPTKLNYTLQVTEGNVCEANYTFNIYDPQPTLMVINTTKINGYDIDCNGNTTRVTTSAFFGNPGYNVDVLKRNTNGTYSYLNSFDIEKNDKEIEPDINFSANSYRFIATDSLGCIITKDVEITQPPKLSLELLGSTNPTCNGYDDGTINVKLTGGVKPYKIIEYHVDNHNDVYENNYVGIVTEEYLLDKKLEGKYSYSFIDKNNCTLPGDMIVDTLTAPDPIMFKHVDVKNPLCYDYNTGEITFTVSGRDNELKNYQLLKDGIQIKSIENTIENSITFDSLSAGNYSIIVTDNNGCPKTETFIITAPAPLSYTLYPKNITCKGDSSGEVDVEIMGGTKNYSLNLISGADTLAYVTGIDSSSKSFTNLAPGKYSIALADQNGCPVFVPEISEVTIAEPEESLDIILSSNPVRCYGENSGSITATAQYGWGNYVFSINSANGGTAGDTVIFYDYPKNDYMVFVKDSMGCTISGSISITQPEPLKTDTVFVSNVRCFGGNNGEVRVVPVGGNGDYRFLFENDIVEDDTKTDLLSGTYNISITDKLNCSFNTTVKVEQPAEFNLTKSLSNYMEYNVRCNGFSDSVSLKLAGGTAPYSYTLTHTELNEIFDSRSNLQSNIFVANGLVAGNYILEFTDSHNCPFSETIELTQPEKLRFNPIYLVQPKCHDGSDGKIEVSGMIGGVSDYDFYLSAFTNSYYDSTTGLTAKFQNLKSDTVTISVTDSNECLIDTTLFLGQPEPVVPKFFVEPVTCKGDSNGSIMAELTGGNGLYSSQWFSASNDSLSNAFGINSKPAGEYFFEAKDSNGCIAKNSEENNERFKVTIPEPETHLSISGYNITEPSCFGFSNGLITINSIGGWSKHEYSITSSSSGYSIDNSFNHLSSGNYTVWLRDSIGCVEFADIEVNQPDSLKLLTNLVEDVSCFGESSGIVELSATGGNDGYNYSRSTGESNQDGYFGSLSAGEHLFSVTDSKGCEDFIDVEIDQPSQIVYTVTKLVQPICGGSQGELEISPSGGTNPYQIDWANQSLPGTFSLSNLTSGSYAFTLKDSKGCTRTFTELLNDIDGPSVQLANVINPSCDYRNDGSIQIFVTGGTQPHSISWIGENQTWQGTETLQNISKGNYTVKVTDSNGCLASKSVSLSAPTALNFDVSTKPVSCYGTSTGLVSVTPQGGTPSYFIGWYNKNLDKLGNGEAIEGLPAGNYFMSIKDINLCGITSDSDTLSQAISVTQPQSPLKGAIDKIISPSCSGGNNGQLTLNGSGGWGDYRYSIDSLNFLTNPVFDNQIARTGKGYVTDKHNCVSTISFTIGEPEQIVPFAIEVNDTRCYGEASGTVKVSSSGGTPPYSYSINNGTTWINQNTFFGLPLGNYSVTVKDKNSCLGLLNLSIGEPEELIADVSSVISTYCGTSNGEISLTAVGGTSPYTVDWNHLDKPWGLTATKLPKGSYSATVYDSHLCETTATVEMPELDGPKIQNFSVLEPLCNNSSDGQIEVDFLGISQPFSYFINGNKVDTTFVDGLPKGEYIFTVADRFNCVDSKLINLVAPDPISINFSNVQNPQCFGYSTGSIASNVSGGTPPYSYSWSNNQKVSALSNIPAGNYQLTVTDDHNCAQSATVALFDPEQITTDLPNEVALCIDQTVALDAQNPGCQYWWTSTNGFESSNRVVTLAEGGLYFLQVTNNLGCFTKDTVLVKKFNHTVSATLLVPSTAHVGDTVVVVDISWPIPDSLFWFIPNDFALLVDSPYEKHIRPTKEGLYDITLITYVGECSAFNEKSIGISQQPTPEIPKTEEIELIKSITLAPNPARYSTQIGVELNVESDINIQIYNGFGLRVIDKKLSGSQSYTVQVPLNGLMGGMYLVKVTAAGSYRTVKLIVK